MFNNFLSKVKTVWNIVSLPDITKGLSFTMQNIWREKVTVRFPFENIPVSPRFRGLHALRRYKNGRERCIACKLCEAVCPARAIKVVSGVDSNGGRYAKSYEIDLVKCLYCGACERACPVNAIVMTRIQHYVFEDRKYSKINKLELLNIGDVLEDQIKIDRASLYPISDVINETDGKSNNGV